MATSKLTTIAQKRNSLDYPKFSRDSTLWMQRKVATLRDPGYLAKTISQEADRSRGGSLIGGVYFFYYEPKLAAKLPYYDTFPLVIILQKYSDGFLGLNMHYLPVMLRAAFMDMLMDFAHFDVKTDAARINASYNILKTTQRLKAFRPCLKRYLVTNMGSKPLLVDPSEWETAMWLPVEQFHKKPKAVVQEDSLNKIY